MISPSCHYLGDEVIVVTPGTDNWEDATIVGFPSRKGKQSVRVRYHVDSEEDTVPFNWVKKGP